MKQSGTAIDEPQSSNARSSTKKNWKYLMFNLGYSSSNDKITFIEIPLRYNRRPSSIVSPKNQVGDDPEKIKILNATFDRLLIYKNKSTGAIDQVIITYIPDADYLKRHNNDISSNQIDKLDTDFNGYIQYKKWDDTNISLLRIRDGKTVRGYVYQKASTELVSGTDKLKPNPIAQSSSTVCTLMYTEHWLQQCWSSDPEGTDMQCGSWTLQGVEYWYDCYYTGGGPPLTGDPCLDYGICGGAPTPPSGEPAVPTSITIPMNGPKIDPKKETKCFDKTQPATMTIYVQQPNENSRDMMGENSVGHCFVGITQGGVTRHFGFYPDSPAASVISSQDSEIHENSGEMYHVSISKTVTASQLTNIINYINNYPPKYTLKSYNCTDFAIAVAGEGALNLPATTGTYSLFSGRNPGDLGQDLRSATLPSGVTRNTTKSNAPAKNGTCP